MKDLKLLTLCLGMVISLAGCNVLPFKDQVHRFHINNESSANVKSIVIELDDGDRTHGESHVFDSIQSGPLIAGDSTEMHYKFGKPKNGDGGYRIIATLDNGKVLKLEFGYIGSSQNVTMYYKLAIRNDEVVYITRGTGVL